MRDISGSIGRIDDFKHSIYIGAEIIYIGHNGSTRASGFILCHPESVFGRTIPIHVETARNVDVSGLFHRASFGCFVDPWIETLLVPWIGASFGFRQIGAFIAVGVVHRIERIDHVRIVLVVRIGRLDTLLLFEIGLIRIRVVDLSSVVYAVVVGIFFKWIGVVFFDLVTIPQTVTVGIFFERIGTVCIDLFTVAQTVAVGVWVVGIGTDFDLFLVIQTVIVGIGIVGICAVFDHLFTVAQTVAVGVRVVGIGMVDIGLVVVAQAVTVPIFRSGM